MIIGLPWSAENRLLLAFLDAFYRLMMRQALTLAEADGTALPAMRRLQVQTVVQDERHCLKSVYLPLPTEHHFLAVLLLNCSWLPELVAAVTQHMVAGTKFPPPAPKVTATPAQKRASPGGQVITTTLCALCALLPPAHHAPPHPCPATCSTHVPPLYHMYHPCSAAPATTGGPTATPCAAHQQAVMCPSEPCHTIGTPLMHSLHRRHVYRHPTAAAAAVAGLAVAPAAWTTRGQAASSGCWPMSACAERRRGASGSLPNPATLSNTESPVYFEQQELSFCQVHAVNDAHGHRVMTGQQLLLHCYRLAAHNAAWGQVYEPGVGNFSVAAVNHWLFHNTVARMVYQPWAQLVGECLAAG
jgi:hypothetical protein